MNEPVLNACAGNEHAGHSVRPAVPADLPAIVKLEETCFTVPWSEESLAAELADRDRVQILVAVDQAGAVIGYVDCWFVFDEGQINNVAVAPDWRRSGIASALLQCLQTRGDARGIQSYSLEVRRSNRPALALYRKLGFVEAGVRRGYYADNNEDAIIMLKKRNGQENNNVQYA